VYLYGNVDGRQRRFHRSVLGHIGRLARSESADGAEVETYSPGGTTVEYETPAATDTVDHDVTVTCAPASNQVCKVGTTTVKCTGTDDAGNQAKRRFNVTVELLDDVNSNPGPGQREQATRRQDDVPATDPCHRRRQATD
jgi:hypothetical protein